MIITLTIIFVVMAVPIRVLLVDDDQDDRDLFGFGIFFQTVKGGAELQSYLDACHPEKLPALIVLDLNMPHPNGLECLTRLSMSQNHNQIPVVIFSTSIPQPIKQKCFVLGAMSCFEKPIEFNTYKEIVSYIIHLV